jgi:hypothetical protein
MKAIAKTVKFETLQIRLPSDLLAWIDKFRAGLKIRPTRSETIRYLVERGKAHEAGDRS